MEHAAQYDIEYVDVRQSEPTSFYEQWLDQASAKHANPELIAADALRRLYPGYSLVISDDYRLSSLLALPGVTLRAMDSQEARSEQVLNVVFTPMSRHSATSAPVGSLTDSVIFASRKLTWNERDFIVHIAKFQVINCISTAYFILHNGPEQPARDLVLAVSIYAEQIHDEIWTFNNGHWSKNRTLWLEIKGTSWDDVVMKEESKKALQKDIYGFFKSEMMYKKLSIPWKRGLIMYGPPGNGKTNSIKVIMKTCADRGFTPLYVQSFQGMQGEEVGMQRVFLKARQLAPCVLILEDLDSLINDKNRSFFLNQLDGLEGNDGLLVIATTNHFDRLDSGLSNRPSRFDRKYLFDDPDYQERVLYAKYWQEKLKDHDGISLPVPLIEEVAHLTQGFSFAYLKEVFVATLVRMTSVVDDDEQVVFPVVLKNQITSLCNELGKQTPALPVVPTARPEKALNKLVKQSSREDTPIQSSRDAGHLSLPTDVPSTGLGVSHGSAQSVSSSHSPGSRVGGKVCGIGSTTRSDKQFSRGCVLHAPPSAYPQVMPGSLLPPPGPDQLQLNRSAWRIRQRQQAPTGISGDEHAGGL